MYKIIASAAAAWLILAFIAQADAVTLQINASGQLTGATGVNVGGNLYNVTFAEGTCSSVYGACEASRFDFKTSSDALLAAQALISQVFVGEFDTDVHRIFGCSRPTTFCDSIIPFASHVTPQFGSTFNLAAAHNWYVADDAAPGQIQPYNKDWADVFPVIAGGVNVSYDTTAYPENDGVNWARFTPSITASVPEPLSWAMMLMGLGIIGVALRTRGTAPLATQRRSRR